MILFFRDIAKGIRRRKKEILLLAIVEFTVMALITAALLFQHNSENYNFERNKSYYGDWVVAEVITDADVGRQVLKEHPYFSNYGKAVSGIKLVDSGGKKYNYYLGSMDEEFIALGHIELREGHFPKADDEIAMETSLLIEMGYSTSLGQDIVLQFTDDEGNSENRSFKLVGVIRKSATLWSIGEYMPAAVVTESMINNLSGSTTTTYCYRLSQQYKDIDTNELYNNLNEKYYSGKKGGWELKYNTFLYSTSFWGTQEMYAFVEKTVVLLGMAAMSFLLAAYIQKRKKSYYSLRIIGLSKLMVKLVIIFESLCFGVLSGIAGILVSMLFGGLLSYYLTVSKGLLYFYEIPLTIVIKALLTWLIIFAGSNLVAIIVTGRKRLYDNASTISTKLLFRWQLNKLKRKHIYSSIFIREHKVFKLRSLSGSLILVAFSSLLLLSAARLWEEYTIYKYVQENHADFVALKSAEEPAEAGVYAWTNGANIQRDEYSYGKEQLYSGYSDGFYEQLDNIPGIASYSLSAFDNSHLFEWDNMENDPYIRALLTKEQSSVSFLDENGNRVDCINTMEDVLEGNSLFFGYEGWYVSDKKIFDKYAKDYPTPLLDYDEFKKGNQVIVIMPEVGSFITEGSTIKIVAGNKKIEVCAACVIPTDKSADLKYAHYILPQSFSPDVTEGLYILGSEGLGRKIAEAEGQEYLYNRIEINMDGLANYNTTVKQCAELLDMDNMNVETMYEIKQLKLNEWITTFIMYFTFIALLSAFFIIIRNNIIQAGFIFEGNRIMRLQMLGMDKIQIKKMYLLQGLYESKWIWLALLVTYSVRGFEIYKEYNGSQYRVYIEELGTYTEDIRKIIRYTIDSRVNIWICLAVMLMIVLFNVVTRYFVARRYLRNTEV